jgi:hypothetical protein
MRRITTKSAAAVSGRLDYLVMPILLLCALQGSRLFHHALGQAVSLCANISETSSPCQIEVGRVGDLGYG